MVGYNLASAPDHTGLFSGSSSGEVDFRRIESDARQRIADARRARDAPAVDAALRDVRLAAAGTENLLPPTISALRAGASVQEIVQSTREGFEQ